MSIVFHFRFFTPLPLRLLLAFLPLAFILLAIHSCLLRLPIFFGPSFPSASLHFPLPHSRFPPPLISQQPLPQSLIFCPPNHSQSSNRGSHTHQVNMFNMNGTLLNSIEPPPSFLPARTNPIAATAFHPHHMTLAYSSLHDQHINLVSCPHKERAVWPEV